jgi:RHS repeat-associated protein
VTPRYNGNVEKVLTRSGAVVAAFQYDAFGNTISETIAQGLTPNAFSFRFSTKYWDSETGLYYYGYRYYSPKKGRWLSRDPIAENGGVNLYGFVGNNGVFKIDLLGLYDILIISDGSCDAGDFLDEVQGVVDTVANACCEEFGLGCGKINVKESDTGIPDNEFLKPNDGSYSLSQEQRTCLVAGNMAVANGANIGVVITANSLHGNSVGVNYDTQGIIITSGNINGIPHEAGHAGGYTDPSNPDDPSHSGDDDHVMDSPDSGAGVDIRYCCSVFGGED